MSITHPRTIGPSSSLAAALSRVAAVVAAAFTRAERSHHCRLGFAFVSPEVLRDIHLSAEEATGLPSQQPDLPFFMQTDFDRR
jgi:hypothetical protein